MHKAIGLPVAPCYYTDFSESSALLRIRGEVRGGGEGTNLKVIIIKYFLSQLKLLFWLQHPVPCDSVLNWISAPYQAASESSLATHVFLSIPEVCLESCGNASFLSIFLRSKHIPKRQKRSNWWLDILSSIPELLYKCAAKTAVVESNCQERLVTQGYTQLAYITLIQAAQLMIMICYTIIMPGMYEIKREHFILDFADFSHLLSIFSNDFLHCFYATSDKMPSYMIFAPLGTKQALVVIRGNAVKH